jgi:hypothetical protein
MVDSRLVNPLAEEMGEILVAVAIAVRRYKSEHNLSLGSKIGGLYLASDDDKLLESLPEAAIDLISITRASEVVCVRELNQALTPLPTDGAVKVAIQRLNQVSSTAQE